MTRKRAASVALLVRTLELERSIACLTMACLTVLAEVNLSPPPARVVLWDRFEVTSVNRRPYSDPHNDVALDVIYIRSGGAKVRSRAFYDKGQRGRCASCPSSLVAGAIAGSFPAAPRRFRERAAATTSSARCTWAIPSLRPTDRPPCGARFLIWRAVKATTGCRSWAIPRVAISTAAAKAGECRGSGPSMRASTVVWSRSKTISPTGG
jgi:hypothetical protein